MDEVRKAVDMRYGLVDEFDFWEYKVTGYYKDTNSGGRFAEYVNMFLKVKQESSGYTSWVQSEKDKLKHIEDYQREEGIAFDKASISKNAGHSAFANLKLISMWSK